MHTVPLLDADMNKPNIPPNAGPEVIDLEPTASVIDDGLSPPNRPGIMPGSRQVVCLTPSCRVIMMICIALVAANLSQLKYVLESGDDILFYYVGLISISLSIILEAAVFLGMIFRDLYNEEREVWKPSSLNACIITGITLIFFFNFVTIKFLIELDKINMEMSQ
ncbi:uncharacterized protein LOC111870547 [Cryptotermes secundus]|uniref:uncharacterized protein LOC111870547 n=1 Tax=Cryptotermes secundus TaxID=105785 RepID=UPI000CD7D22C|nr:uncharacterized protein LOC111870547 [Cryptotermes secundus]XP_023718683.1 uncharacterized protein LOC111870547 [Cryptotermes secundus]XP_023718684.1 uncharacterized protein LOC111870547 [Cryptotermes secundus]XP_023718685.1 uncharacterized protein LOC111870547 [Cryptotermes secundus]XP_023718686.1 uncharacterized protein LOC111870547 [Cryptotermes secundus]XP_023718687.1 uncharacterized protein LOC111870547 [Cryptotermes secundus]XP_033609781.1 uncharacterized protein LOC111870547 [Crypto